MAEYIDKETVFKILRDVCSKCGCEEVETCACCDLAEVTPALQDASAADVVPRAELQALKESFMEAMAEQNRKFEEDSLEILRKIHENVMSDDVVPVVRCKECKWYEPENSVNPPFCNHPAGVICGGMPPMFFCADGERKED